MGYVNDYNRDQNSITIAQYGTAGYVKWQSEKFWANDVTFTIVPSKEVLNRYIYYVLKNKQEYLYEISNRTAVPYSISKDRILKIKIPIPPLEIQREIVEILDKFDALTNSISEGLPHEIKLRQKQYEYYRKKLLSLKS
jgi:type I restriction enzyme S subunit